MKPVGGGTKAAMALDECHKVFEEGYGLVERLERWGRGQGRRGRGAVVRHVEIERRRVFVENLVDAYSGGRRDSVKLRGTSRGRGATRERPRRLRDLATDDGSLEDTALVARKDETLSIFFAGVVAPPERLLSLRDRGSTAFEAETTLGGAEARGGEPDPVVVAVEEGQCSWSFA